MTGEKGEPGIDGGLGYEEEGVMQEDPEIFLILYNKPGVRYPILR